MSTPVAFLIPCKGHSTWKKMNDSHLHKYTLSSFSPEKSHTYIFYIGYDHNDTYYTQKNIQSAFIKEYSKYKFRFVAFDKDVIPGHLTKMWNVLFTKALIDDKYFINYFYQCGDDILFKSKGWVEETIQVLRENKNIGGAGPKTDHPDLLTQIMITRNHYKFFECLFPEEIFNWGCDDWINLIYQPKHLFVLNNHSCINSGGKPRYKTDNYNIIALKKKVGEKAFKDKNKIVE